MDKQIAASDPASLRNDLAWRQRAFGVDDECEWTDEQFRAAVGLFILGSATLLSAGEIVWINLVRPLLGL
jgi:hypothetical protein